MKRLLPLLLALIGGLCTVPAYGQLLQGGYDDATRELEAGFKIVATARIGSRRMIA